MEKPVLMLTKKAIKRISNRVNYYTYFFELLLKLQDYIRILEYESILLIDKNLVDKIKNKPSETNNSTELSIKPLRKTDLERMFGYYNTVTIFKNSFEDCMNEPIKVFDEIESFYAYSNFEIIFESYYKRLLEIELKCRVIETKIYKIIIEKRYKYGNFLLENPEFKNVINSEYTFFKNGIISNEKGEHLVIDNFYYTNIRLSLRWFADSSEQNYIDDIKCCFEKYMPSLVKEKQNNSEVLKYSPNIKLMACFFIEGQETYKEYSEKHEINKGSLKAYISKVYKHEIDAAISNHAEKIRSFLSENYNGMAIKNFDEYLRPLQQKK